MLIQTLPPRRMCRLIAIRADSICRFVTYAGSSAWMPNSPKVTRVPPVEAPVRCGRCCLRCLTLRGMNTSALPTLRGLLGLDGGDAALVLVAASSGGPTGLGAAARGARGTRAAALRTVAPRRAVRAARGRSRRALAAATDHVTLVDPHLDADATEGR